MLLIGRIEHIAEICELTEKAPFHWKRASGLHEAGDVRSARQMRRLLDYSDAHKLGLTADHLVRGAARADIEAILDARSAPQVAAE